MRKQIMIEKLEPRKVLSAYSVEILDTENLVSDLVEDKMRDSAHFVMNNLNYHLEWQGTIDLQINILPFNDPNYKGGVTPAILQNVYDPIDGLKNATIHEMITGEDLRPDHPDVGMVVYMPEFGDVSLYGMPFYFDPNPYIMSPVDVPEGHVDFIGVLNHEVAHGLGFQGSVEFVSHIKTINEIRYFFGDKTIEVFGRPLDLTTMASTHYSGSKPLEVGPFFNNYESIASIYLDPTPRERAFAQLGISFSTSQLNISSGLMYEWGRYAGNRLDWGKLEFAILEDLGINVRTTSGLPLTDRIDDYAPKLISNVLNINENQPTGTTILELDSIYTYQIIHGNSFFEIIDNKIVSKTNFDYESMSSYKGMVRIIDEKSVWTNVWFDVLVNDIDEAPVLSVPEYIWAGSGVATMSGIKIFGDKDDECTIVFSSKTALFESYIKDPNVDVYISKNIWGGTNIYITGLAEDLTENMRQIIYWGSENSVSVTCLESEETYNIDLVYT